MPVGRRSGRTSSSTTRRRMIMRVLSRRLPALAAATVLAAACAACGGSQPTTPAASPAAGSSFPAMVSAANGAVHIGSRPDAIVSLSPTATEMLYAIGAGSQVKAVDNDSDYPRQAPITRLSGLTPNAEAIAASKPDLVIISNNMDGITAKLTALSLPVLNLPAAASLSDVYAEFTELGAATGHAAQARAMDSMLKADIRQIVAAEPAHTKPLTYYYEVATNPYYSVTSSTFIGSLLSLLGMKSVADAATGARSEERRVGKEGRAP